MRNSQEYQRDESFPADRQNPRAVGFARFKIDDEIEDGTSRGRWFFPLSTRRAQQMLWCDRGGYCLIEPRIELT
jgi:hypothetical protein